MTDPLQDLRYPIGQFEPPAVVAPQQVAQWIADIAALPADLRRVVTPLTERQLDTRYRPEGWTVRQVVHHVADSHLNSVVRFKWALTEDRPVIKAYEEALWAELADYRETPMGLALDFLDALHARWCILLESLGPEDLEREFVHPDTGPVRLAVNVGIYAWHGRHHLAHIEQLARREEW